MKRLLFVLLLCFTAYGQRVPRVVDSVASLVALTPSATAPDVVLVATNSNTRIQFRYYPTASDSTNSTSPYVYATGTGTGRWKEVRLTGDLTGVTIDGSAISSTGKLDITNGTPVIAGVTIGTNTLAHLEIGGLFPLTADATNYWAVGDSWTYGQFVVAHQWTSAGSPYLMFSPLLYCNILSTNYGLNLTNRGVSGSRLARTAGAPDSTLAQLNVVPTSWSGLVTLAHGYNDSTTETYGDVSRTHTLFRNAATAAITKLLAYDYGNAQGKRLDGTTLGGWSTAGSVTDGGNAGKAPFPTGSAATNTVQFLTLTSTQTITFAATNAVVWLENSSAGGVVQLWQGTNWIATADLSTPSQTYFLPQALVARGRSGTFTLTNVSGSNVVLGAGSLNNPADTLSKNIVLMAPGRLGASGRMDSVGKSIGQAYASAAQDYQEFRVFFADVPSRLDLSTMIPSGDADHPDPRGHIAIVDAIKNAVHAPANSDLNSPGTRYVQGGLQVQGAQIATAQLKTGPSVFLAMATGDNGYLDALDYATSTYYPLNFRAKNVIVPNSGLTVSGGYSSVSQYPSGNFTSLAMSGGQGYLDSQNYDGVVTTTYLPLNLRAKSTRISGGGLTVSAGPTGTNDYPSGAFTQLAVAGSIGYLDSLTFPGSSAATFIPLEIRAKVTQFGTAGSGGVTVHSGVVSTNDYPNDDFLSLGFSGGESYLDSITNQAGVFSLLPINLRGSRVQVGQPSQGGGLVVQGSFSSTNQYPAGAFVSLAMSGNEAYLDAQTNSGTAVTKVPLNIRANGVIVSPGSQGMGLAVQGAYSGITDYPTNKFLALALSGGEAYIDAYDRTGGTNLAGIPINLRGSAVTVNGNPVLSYTGTPTTGQIAVHTNGAWTVMTPGSSGGIGGSTGSTDNRVLRADGTGGATVQNSAISVSDVTAYSSQDYVQVRAIGSGTKTHYVITPEGTGAFILGPPPDGTATGGNNRGNYAVDLQMQHFNGTSVASGTGSLAAGYHVITSGAYSGGVGYSLTISGDYGFGTGINNTASTGYNIVFGQLSTQSGGYGIAGGYNVTASGSASSAFGNTTTASGIQSFVTGGNVKAYLRGQVAQGAGQFAAQGDAQASKVVVRNNTSSTTQTTLFLDGSSTAVDLPANTSWTFRADVIGTTASAAATYSYTLQGVIIRAASTASMPAAVTQTVIYESNAGADCTAEASTNALAIKVTAANSTATRWVSTIYLTEVSF